MSNVSVKGITLRGNPTIELKSGVDVEKVARRLRPLVRRLRKAKGKMRLNTLIGKSAHVRWSARILVKLGLAKVAGA